MLHALYCSTDSTQHMTTLALSSLIRTCRRSLACTFLIAIVSASTGWASVLCVDDDNQNASPDGSTRNPYAGIQAAVMASMPFDTIKVAVGNYGPVNNMGKALTILGGYTGASTANYAAGMNGNFSERSTNPAMTNISAGLDSIAVNITRYSFDAFSFALDNCRVFNSRKGVVCDIAVSWPHAENVSITNNIIESNGEMGIVTRGAGIYVSGNRNRILNNIIRNNRGGRGAGICGNREGDTLLIEGNQILGNYGYDDHCGGVYLGGYVEMRKNVIAGNRVENSYGWGGGVLILGTAYLSNNIYRNNYCPTYGGALFVDEGGTAYLENELIYNNRADESGAAVAIDNGEPGSSRIVLTNCTIVNNFSPGTIGGNALFVDNGSFATMKNCICYGNGDDFNVQSSSLLSVSYTLSTEYYLGVGNFSKDPLFADTSRGDFHLQSTQGRYDPVTQTWINDNVYSPAIDAGDPASSYSREPSPHGNRINLGCYGNTEFASKSVVPTQLAESDRNTNNGCQLQYKSGESLLICRYPLYDNQDLELCVYNVVGQVVLRCPIRSSLTEHPLHTPLGLYFFSLSQNGTMLCTGTLLTD